MNTIFKEDTSAPEDLSFVAETLLALCAKDRDAPFYSEDGFKTKLDRLRARQTDAAVELVSGRIDSLLAVECRDVLQGARLTPRQRQVLDLRLEGFTFEEIGSHGRTTKQGAMRVFTQALKKVSRTFGHYRYAGLSEVYRSEVDRRSRGGTFGTMGR